MLFQLSILGEMAIDGVGIVGTKEFERPAGNTTAKPQVARRILFKQIDPVRPGWRLASGSEMNPRGRPRSRADYALVCSRGPRAEKSAMSNTYIYCVCR